MNLTAFDCKLLHTSPNAYDTKQRQSKSERMILLAFEMQSESEWMQIGLSPSKSELKVRIWSQILDSNNYNTAATKPEWGMKILAQQNTAARELGTLTVRLPCTFLIFIADARLRAFLILIA